MRRPFYFFSTLFLAVCVCLESAAQLPSFSFEPTPEHPFGLPNPESPAELLDWAPLIGEHECISQRRKSDQSWEDPVNMAWRFKYIMNGTAVQDETLKSDGFYSGSIRQFIPDSNHWYVHYYSNVSPSTILPSWEGNRQQEGDIVLYRPQKAPNGMDGFYKIVFSHIGDGGFKWLGAWVSTDESFVFPTWKIDCSKTVSIETENERTVLLGLMDQFSRAYMDADYDKIAAAYTTDGKIFPANVKIIEGRKDIKEYWQLPEGSVVEHHKILPERIHFTGGHAYDYGYYEGRTRNKEGAVSSWKGKYVIVWKKEDGEWKIYLDIWNRVAS